MDFKTASATAGLLAVLCCSSCFSRRGGSSAAEKPIPAPTGGGSVSQEKAARLSGNRDIRVVTIPDSRGIIGTETVKKGLSSMFGASGEVQAVRQELKGVRDQGRPAFVTGNSPQRTAAVLLETLKPSRFLSLRGLVIYTNAPVSADLKEMGRAAGVSVLAVSG